MDISPNIDNAIAFESLFTHHNIELFERKLIVPKLTLIPLAKTDAQFIRDGFKHPKTGLTCHELQLNQELVNSGKRVFCEHLVHLMVHYFQYEFGNKKPTKHDHNKEFVAIMRAIGFSSDEPYGRSVEFTPIPGGKFMKALATSPELTLLKPTNTSALLDMGEARDKPKKDRKTTYRCEQCGQTVFGGKNLVIACGKCSQPMVKVEAK